MKKLHRKRTVHPSPPTISDQLSFLPATILTLTVALSPEDREVLAYLISCSSSSFNGGNPRRTTKGGGVVNVDGDHPPLFHCSCFRCYMSYWVRWDSSPNHQLIHEIIDAFEDSLAAQTNNKKVKRNKRGSNNNNNNSKSPESKRSEFVLSSPRNSFVPAELESVGESSSNSNNSSSGVGEGGDGVEDEEKGSNNNNNKSPELKRSEFAPSSPPNSSVSAELESVGESSSSSSSSNDSSGGVGEGGDGVKDEEKGSVRRFVSFIGERIWGAWGQ